MTTGLGRSLRRAGEVGTGAGVAGASGIGSSSDSCLHTFARSDNGSPFFPFPLPLAFLLFDFVPPASVTLAVGSFSSLAVFIPMQALLLTGVPKAGLLIVLLGGVRATGGGPPLREGSLDPLIVEGGGCCTSGRKCRPSRGRPGPMEWGGGP